MFNLDETEDHHGGNASLRSILSLLVQVIYGSHHCLFFFAVLDLNLPLDEFGAVDFDYVQNLAGNFFLSQSHLF
jgi:hypothetical protein